MKHEIPNPDAVSGPVAIALRGVGKQFGGVHAVHAVDLEVRAGEVHAVLGENGAGKSTLVKILAGIYKPDEGTVEIDGSPVAFSSPTQSIQAGVGVVHQELSLFPDLDIAENIYLGRYPRRFGVVMWRSVYANAREHLSDLGVRMDVRTKLRQLSVAERQIVEIAKALSLNARILVLDEPTAALSAGEVEDFFAIIRSLRDRGTAVVFVGHRLEEIRAIADRVTILRDAARVSTGEAHRLSNEDLISQMIGRKLDALFPKVDVEPGEVVLAVEHLSRAGAFEDVSFAVRRGEIVGVCGLVGAGRTEVARVLFGIDSADSGLIEIAGKRVRINTPSDAMRHGIAYVPEDRHEQGVVLDWSIGRNSTLAILSRIVRWGLIRRRTETELVNTYINNFSVKCSSSAQQVSTLSGGNQQKVVLAKWLATEPRILILDEPTRGVDIGTKADVHRLISGLAAEGLAIVLISSELPEIIGMSDRILVLHEGRVAGEFTRADANQEALMTAATGQSS